MPEIFYQPVGRRQFLSQISITVGGLALGMAAMTRAEESADAEKTLRVALLSDTHIPADPKNEYRKFFPQENLKTIVPQVLEARPAGVIHTGDAARLSGELADYQALKELLSPLAEKIPVYIGLGNHDHRQNFVKVFENPAAGVQNVTGKHVLMIERPYVRLVVLDSLLYCNQVAGLLGKAQRVWLAKFLETTDDRPTLFFVHHTLGDGDGDLLDTEKFYRLLQPHKKVKAIFYGHSHVYKITREQGLHLVNLPATGYNFQDSDPVGWVDATFTGKGVDLTLRAIGGNRQKDGEVTSLAWG